MTIKDNKNAIMGNKFSIKMIICWRHKKSFQLRKYFEVRSSHALDRIEFIISFRKNAILILYVIAKSAFIVMVGAFCFVMNI